MDLSIVILNYNTRDHLRACLQGLLVEGSTSLSGGSVQAEAIVYCGSTLAENPALRSIVETFTRLAGHGATFLRRGAYCGAVGAAASAAPPGGGRAPSG